MRPVGFLAVAAFLAGIVLVVLAVIDGRATVSLVVIVPVVTGASGEFLLGVVLIVVGMFALPWALAEEREEDRPLPTPEAQPGSSPASGGLVLVGPVPIFFGSWRGVSRRTRWIVALVGTVVLALFVIGWWLALR